LTGKAPYKVRIHLPPAVSQANFGIAQLARPDLPVGIHHAKKDPARMRQSDKNTEDQRVDGTTAGADNVRSRGLPVPRSRRMNRAQPKAGQEINNAFSHSLGLGNRAGRPNCILITQGRGDGSVKGGGDLEATGALGRPEKTCLRRSTLNS
jgi:hypothetical protein